MFIGKVPVTACHIVGESPLEAFTSFNITRPIAIRGWATMNLSKSLILMHNFAMVETRLWYMMI